MVSYLDEKAMNVAQELSDRELYDYDALVGLLSARFDPASRVSASRSRFHGRTCRHQEDADTYADSITELCRLGYPQSSPELRQELISEQFVRGQSDPELKKYLWVVIRTQKDKKTTDTNRGLYRLRQLGSYDQCSPSSKVPVLVSNFGQETVVVNPFTEVGMIAQVTAIHSVTDDRLQRRGATGELPHHLRDLVDQTSGDLDGDQRRRLAGVLLKYADIFPVPGDPLTGHTDAVEHDINTGDRSPMRCAPRRMSPQKMKKEEDCVTEMLTGGQIEASDSPWSSPVVLVTKKDGGTRFCVDYRQLNDATIKDAYPLPRIDDTLDMLAGKQWFSTLDLASGYWQVSLSKDARAKTAFATHSGLFQFRVMPFGLCNAPATFERLMDRVLQGLRWNRCLVYLDDIISFGGTFSAALSNLTLIFERLRSYGLQLKSSKCHLFRASVPFLGHIVGRRGLECDPKKIEDVKSWPVPDGLKSV